MPKARGKEEKLRQLHVTSVVLRAPGRPVGRASEGTTPWWCWWWPGGAYCGVGTTVARAKRVDDRKDASVHECLAAGGHAARDGPGSAWSAGAMLDV